MPFGANKVTQTKAECLVCPEEQAFYSRLGATEDGRDLRVFHILIFVHEHGTALFLGQLFDGLTDFSKPRIAQQTFFDIGDAVGELPGSCRAVVGRVACPDRLSTAS